MMKLYTADLSPYSARVRMQIYSPTFVERTHRRGKAKVQLDGRAGLEAFSYSKGSSASRSFESCASRRSSSCSIRLRDSSPSLFRR